MTSSTTIPNLPPASSVLASALIWINQGGVDYRSTVSQWQSATVINQAPTGQFFQNLGANIDRLNDRAFFGPATVADGFTPAATTAADYISQYQNSVGESPSITTSQVAIFGQHFNTSLQSTLFVTSDTLALNANGSDAVGLELLAINRNTAFTTNVWGIYGEVHRRNAAVLQSILFEGDTYNTVSSVSNTPYGQSAGETVLLQLAAGAGLSAVGQFNATAAIQLLSNPMAFNAGIIFFDGSIADPGNGVKPAIKMAKGMALTWADSTAGGTESAFVQGNVATTALGTAIVFDDNGFQVGNHADANRLLVIPALVGAASHLQITAGLTGSGATVATVSTDTNSDLTISAQAAGVVKFGNAGSFAANGSVATALTSVGPTGSHTTVQEWLTIKDNSGTVRYIPCF